MSKFNIFSIGNGISYGQNTRSNLDSTRHDTKWKKTINHHPDNLYRSWVDYLAMRLDAKIFYLGKHDIDIKKSVNLLDNLINTVNKDFPNDINLYVLNTSTRVSSSLFHSFSRHKQYKAQWDRNTDSVNLKEAVDPMLCYHAEYTGINKLVDIINNKTNYNNRVIIFNIDKFMFTNAWLTWYKINFVTELYKTEVSKINTNSDTSESLSFDNIINRQCDMEWAHILKDDLNKIILKSDPHKLDDLKDTIIDTTHIPESYHRILGEESFKNLTNDSKLLTI